MIKLWKVTVNGIGWSSPDTYYFERKADAQAFVVSTRDNGRVCDGVEYAGRFSKERAGELLMMQEVRI